MDVGLRAEEKEAIMSYYVPLLDCLKVGLNDIINRLYQKKLFTDSVKDEIECGSTPQEKARTLLFVIRNTDNPHMFFFFTQALNETKHEHIAKALRDKARAGKQDTLQVRDSSQLPREDNVSDEYSPGGATGCFCQESSSDLSREDVGSAGPQFSSQTRVKSYQIPQMLATSPMTQARRELIGAGAGTSHGNPPSSSSSVESRPNERMQSVDEEETSQPPVVSLRETATTFTDSVPDDFGSSSSITGQPVERMQAVVNEETSQPPMVNLTVPHSVPNNLLSNVSRGSNVSNMAARPQISATNHPLEQQQPQAQGLENHLFQVNLSREPDGKFGFKLVSGLKHERARYDGDQDYYITRVYPNTIGARCGLLQENDTIVCVNGVQIRDMQFNDVVKMFQNSTEIVMTLQRCSC